MDNFIDIIAKLWAPIGAIVAGVFGAYGWLVTIERRTRENARKHHEMEARLFQLTEKLTENQSRNKGELFNKIEDLRKELKDDHGDLAKHMTTISEKLAELQGQIKGMPK